jgi:hypothetical protein
MDRFPTVPVAATWRQHGFIENACSNEFFGGLGVWAILKPSRTFEKVCTAANRPDFESLRSIEILRKITYCQPIVNNHM